MNAIELSSKEKETLITALKAISWVEWGMERNLEIEKLIKKVSK